MFDSHHTYAGLQIADAVASGMKAALEYSNYGHTEHRYAKLLKPVTFYFHRRDGMRAFLSYGVKFFPEPPKDGGTGNPRCHWITKYYSPEKAP